MLIDLVNRLSRETGLDSIPTILDLLNRSAQQIWREYELPGTLRTCTLTLGTDRLLAFPTYLGEIRGVRETMWRKRMTMHTQHPRFQDAPFAEDWFKCTVQGYRPIQVTLTEGVVLRFETANIDDNAIVEVVGSTAESNNTAEQTTVSALVTSGTKVWTDIKQISSPTARQYDINIKDQDGNLLAFLANDQRNCMYQILEFSLFPSTPGTAFDILYKPALGKMLSDGDAFPVPQIEDAVYFHAYALWLTQQTGQEQRAQMFGQQSRDIISAYCAQLNLDKPAFLSNNPMLGIVQDYANVLTNRFRRWNEPPVR